MTKERLEQIRKRASEASGYSLKDLRDCIDEIDRLRDGGSPSADIVPEVKVPGNEEYGCCPTEEG